MEAYQKRLWDLYEPLGRKWQSEHSAKQAYIALGLAVAAAAEQKVDATPMEGFDNAKMDEIPGLGKFGLKSVAILPIGYRDEDRDWLVNLKKVREIYYRIMSDQISNRSKKMKTDIIGETAVAVVD